MKYSDTGQFTDEQIKIAKRIKRDLKKLRNSGCIILAKQDNLCAYSSEDMKHAVPLDDYACLCRGVKRSSYIIEPLDLGYINDSGADDEEFFEEGYITEK